MSPVIEVPEDDAHRSWFDVVATDYEFINDDIGRQRPLACGMHSPSSSMLCDLPASLARHFLGQHVGVDRRGNFRGWRDTRPIRP